MKDYLLLHEYATLAAVTESLPPKLESALGKGKAKSLHAAMGICTEAGELVKNLWSKKDVQNFAEEFGDLAWYLVIYRLARPSIFAVVDEWQYPAAWGPSFEALLIYSSELLDISKKEVFYGKVYPHNEIRDAYFKLEVVFEALVKEHGFDIKEIRAANIRKLQKRYGGKFDAAKANNRDIEAEMAALGFGDEEAS